MVPEIDQPAQNFSPQLPQVQAPPLQNNRPAPSTQQLRNELSQYETELGSYPLEESQTAGQAQFAPMAADPAPQRIPNQHYPDQSYPSRQQEIQVARPVGSDLPLESAEFQQVAGAPDEGLRAAANPLRSSDPAWIQDERSVMDRDPIDDPFADRNPQFRPASRFRSLQEQDDARMQSPENGVQDALDPPDDAAGLPDGMSCQEFRDTVIDQSILNIDLNISPYGPGPVGNPNTAFGPHRSWADKYGNIMASGSMVKLRHGYVYVDTGNGVVRVPVARLGDSDLAALASTWETPNSCTLGLHPYHDRCWTPQVFTWKASALCHKPLYFEDIQLERYGHSAGPLRQPVRSTAHFFVNLLTVSYQTGIHHPQECQYALGYYRPGDCAPWLVDPVPISLRGFARQTLTTTAGAFLFFP